MKSTRRNQKNTHIFYLLLFLISLFGCQNEQPETVPPTPEKPSAAVVEQPHTPQEAPTPPTPPLFEDFQGEPQLSLFPRVGDYRPEDDSERFGFWKTFIDHLVKITGLAQNPEDGNRAWSFRSINTIDSVGYFSPLAVAPQTTYAVSFKAKADLRDGASVGIGVIEFNEFLWIGEQYTEATFKEHYRGVHEGVRLTGKVDWPEKSFTFTTGQDTRMVHIILFREGTHDRNGVLFDDIRIDLARSK